MGQLDAAVVPEQYPRMAERLGFKVMITAQDLWPDMPGSVLVVTEKLIQDHPEIVSSLVRVTRKATQWINQNPEAACEIIASQLSSTGDRIFPEKAAKLNSKLEITPEVVNASLTRGLSYSTDINTKDIESTIAYLAHLGYIRDQFAPEEIMDLRWLTQ